MSRILIIDDDPQVRDVLSELLISERIETDVAENLETACAYIEKQRYDAVITDLRLSGTDKKGGLEIVMLVKSTAPQTRIILMTGFGDSEIMAETYNLGADYYLKKPISRSLLMGALHSLGIK